MKKIFAVFGSFLVAMTVLTGCGGGESFNPKEFRVAVGGKMATLDPATADDSITNNVLEQMYDGLYTLDKDGNTTPVLAEALPVMSEGGLKYTIKLKSGIKWSDGEDLTAEDFVYSWKRAIGTKGYYTTFISNYIAGAEAGATMDQMPDFGAKATDANTIEVTLKQPTPFFAALLVNSPFLPVREDFIKENAPDETSSDWAKAKDVPVTGAFKATEINLSDKVVLTKNKKYYDAKEVKLETISYKVMPDSDAQTTAFQSGEIDFATATNVQSILSDKDLKKDVYAIEPFVINYYVLLNSGDENTVDVLKDKEIRKAFSNAIDRKAILKAIGYGEFAYELNGLVPVGIPGKDGDFREETEEAYSEYNIKEAKKIMEAKGYSKSNMLKLTYSYNDLPMHKDAAVAMQASLKDAYIDLTLDKQEKEAFFEVRDKGEFELARHAMTADFLDPMAYLEMYYGPTKLANTVDDKVYEAMLDEANAELDPAVRMEKLHAAEKYLVLENNYIAPLFGYSDPFLLNAKFTGVTSKPNGHYNLTKVQEKK